MPKLSTKHANAEIVLFTDFSGGLNLARPPESIADNEMQAAINFEFAPDTGLLKVRGGLVPVHSFISPVSDIIPIAGTNSVLVRSGDELWRLDDNTAAKVEIFKKKADGTEETVSLLEGSEAVSYEYWGDNNSVLMVFGGPLYLYNGVKLEKIASAEAPTKAHIVFSRNGRVIIAEPEGDIVRYSGVGDPRKWEEGTDADSVSVQVGYKDGCNMKAISTLAGELIIFKCPDGQPEHGRIYRLRGDYPQWSIVPHARGSSAWNPQTVVNVSNDLLFLTREGLGNISTVTEYGDYRMGWAGAKVNPRLSQFLTGKCRVWHIALKGQVWVWDGRGETIWAYHYQIGQNGAWTTLKFPGVVSAVASVYGSTYVGIGNQIYRMNENSTDDNGAPINAVWKPRTLLRKNQILLKGVLASYLSTISSTAKVKIDKFELPLPLAGQGDIARMDDDIAAADEDPLIPSRSSMMRKRCNIRRWDITPEVVVTNGMFNLSSLGLEIAEV